MCSIGQLAGPIRSLQLAGASNEQYAVKMSAPMHVTDCQLAVSFRTLERDHHNG